MSIPNIQNAMSVEYLSKKDEKEKTILEKFKFIFAHLTVEPLIFFYVLAVMVNIMANQNLQLEKACRVNLKFNSSICDALLKRDKNGYEGYHEMSVQQLVTYWNSYRSIVCGSIPVVLMMYLGSWSDRNCRRRPIILLPIIGDLLGVLGLMACSYKLDEWPMEVSWFFDTVPTACFGGWGCCFMGIYSYVAGKSTDENRTLKIGSVSMCFSIAMSIGLFLSGIILNSIGFVGTYAFSIFMISITLLYGYFMVNDDPSKENRELTEKGFLRDFFAFKHIKNTFMICFKEGKANRRKRMIIIMFVAMMIMGPLQGEITVLYVYIRLKFGWNEVDFSMYNSVHFCIQIIGNTFSLSVFTKILQMSDPMLGVISMISKVGGTLIYALAPTGIFFYFGALVEIFNGTAHIALRSLMAKIVPPNELGQSNSIFGMCEALMPLFFGPLYTKIYARTIRIFPGAFYLVSSGIFMITFCLFIWLYIEMRGDKKTDTVEKEKEEVEKTLISKNDPLDAKYIITEKC